MASQQLSSGSQVTTWDGHHVAHLEVEQRRTLGGQAIDDVAFGDDADDVVLGVADDQRADALVAHDIGGFGDRAVGQDSDHVLSLFPDDGTDFHDAPPFRGRPFVSQRWASPEINTGPDRDGNYRTSRQLSILPHMGTAGQNGTPKTRASHCRRMLPADFLWPSFALDSWHSGAKKDLAKRLWSSATAAGFLVFGIFTLTGRHHPDPVVAERALGFGSTLVIAGLLALAASWLIADLDAIWCRPPRRRWWRW
ncbi:MAG TPA: hypothetical protein QGF63_13985 [Alphaproteobacteria bacterium]|jgi:hypothetical protein|nr:hypothetical protein [Alphaproteobacteria bacterium]MDP7429534.1 hypothetical protein [Alphaproteobacteria bacterium]HJM50939.1 hypothetical protein [Alphaproteobacteria bacterium]